MENLDKNDAADILAPLGTREHVGSRRLLWNKSFLAFNQTHFLEWITSQIFEVSSWSFHLDVKNAIKISEIVLGF